MTATAEGNTKYALELEQTLKEWDKQHAGAMAEKTSMIEQRDKEISVLWTRIKELESNSKPSNERSINDESEKDLLISKLSNEISIVESKA